METPGDTDLVRQLTELADDLGAVVASPRPAEQLEAICRAGRVGLGAAAVSVAAVRGDHLEYLAADGRGAEAIVGTHLPLDRGLAGYVARSGQGLAVDGVEDDARFAHDVAVGTGYVPISLLVVPIHDAEGEVLGVLSVLDRGTERTDALTVATALAAQAGPVLSRLDVLDRLGPLLLRSPADSVAGHDDDLAAALTALTAEHAATEAPDAGLTADLREIAELLAHLRRVSRRTRRASPAILPDVLSSGGGRHR